MEYTSEIVTDGNICIVHVTGKYQRPKNSDEFKRFAIDTFNAHGCRLFLFDMTQMEYVPAGIFATFLAANPEDALAKELRNFKVAFVPPEINEEDRFFETVAINRGYQVYAFDSIDKALAWLKQD